MAVIETKFSVGEAVWHAGTVTEQRQHDCPDCLGSRQWIASSPAGDEFTFACPRCNASYSSFDDMSLKYTAFTPSVRRLTIGSVRHDSNSFGEGERTDYMCLETGVGSGQIYREGDLFEDEAAAIRAAELKCAISNDTTEWIAKRYAKTLSISDYQLSSAAIKTAQDQRSAASFMLYNICDLFESIESAPDKDAILEAVEDYKRYCLDGDRRDASADTRPEGGDSTKIEAPFTGGAVPEGQTPK